MGRLCWPIRYRRICECVMIHSNCLSETDAIQGRVLWARQPRRFHTFQHSNVPAGRNISIGGRKSSRRHTHAYVHNFFAEATVMKGKGYMIPIQCSVANGNEKFFSSGSYVRYQNVRVTPFSSGTQHRHVLAPTPSPHLAHESAIQQKSNRGNHSQYLFTQTHNSSRNLTGIAYVCVPWNVFLDTSFPLSLLQDGSNNIIYILGRCDEKAEIMFI